ncbi:GILT-like protein 1 [Tigriopus californicus]|uniref:GILT-like protein 1 n=1 Tax=Tigriopus californicus TaxID=6832 RepID=UPI0027D9F98A|nr:GILT-like protein 1 [Tigriopus californicus]
MTNYKDTVNLLTSGFTSRNNNNGIMQHIGTVVLTLALVSQAQGASKAKLGLYYESLCPDSQDFFQDQFIRTYESLGQYLDVYFNPFGHATYTQTSEGGWTFECQHGPNECYGNLIQACILDRVQDQDIRSEVITCIMTSTDQSTSWEETNKKCIDVVPELDYNDIIGCQSSTEGENLLKNMGEITLSMEPPVSWVPWVIINEVYVEDDFDATQYQLKELLCEKYLSDVPECQ